MFTLKTLSVVSLLLLIVSACVPLMATPSPLPAPTNAAPITGFAVVQSVEIQIREAQPVQVNAIVRGQLPDGGCTTISSVEQVRHGNTFMITLTTTTDPLALCTLAATPFEQVVALNIGDLPPARYTVNANGIETTFELLTRDVTKFKQVLVDALNARNFDLLETLMDDPFMIGYWLSEGTSNTPELAVEQLKTNLLNSSSPITADLNKDLAALLGTDPVTIVGPQVVEASPLFVSGWGAEGKDEAILFVAKLPDGSLYWHGFLFAKDGFRPSIPNTGSPIPLDTNAYPTNVKYIMAQQDVRMRNGPGTQYGIIGFIAAGQTAKVTGVSADGYWWRVICPDNSVGSCWVSAARYLTKPTDGVVTNPPPDNTAHPADVKYVMALQDVGIYNGPGTQYSQISFIAGGQTAKVTGVSANGNWWRVICPDDTVGSCWVSANPNLTRPTTLAGNADVQSVEIQILESYPLQVNAIARGQLPDSGCTTISGATQARSGNTFIVTLTTKTDPQAFCAQVLTSFEYTIALEVGSLLPARYIVRVNGVEESFQLPDSVYPTDVSYVMAQQDVSIYGGPGSQHSVIGSIASGQTAKVTGVSVDSNWWRVMCPDDTVGSCWVTANSSYTQPTQSP